MYVNLVDANGNLITAANPVPTSIVGSLANVAGSTIPKTQPVPTQRIPVRTITTILNAVSVAAGANTAVTSLGLDGTEDEVWLSVNIDKQPFTLYAKTLFATGSANGLFPAYSGHTNIYTSAQIPAMALVLGVIFGAGAQNIPTITTISEAKATRFPYDSSMTAYITNSHATDAATITVKVVRIWR
jgi:hypothetical protein